jgi:hypothetical protein
MEDKYCEYLEYGVKPVCDERGELRYYYIKLGGVDIIVSGITIYGRDNKPVIKFEASRSELKADKLIDIAQDLQQLKHLISYNIDFDGYPSGCSIDLILEFCLQ